MGPRNADYRFTTISSSWIQRHCGGKLTCCWNRSMPRQDGILQTTSQHTLRAKFKLYVRQLREFFPDDPTTKINSATGYIRRHHSCKRRQSYSDCIMQAMRLGSCTNEDCEEVFCSLGATTTAIIVMPFEHDFFPQSHCKQVIVRPRIRKPLINVLDIKAFLPIFNMSFLSKFTERLVVRHINKNTDLLPTGAAIGLQPISL